MIKHSNIRSLKINNARTAMDETNNTKKEMGIIVHILQKRAVAKFMTDEFAN